MTGTLFPGYRTAPHNFRQGDGTKTFPGVGLRAGGSAAIQPNQECRSRPDGCFAFKAQAAGTVPQHLSLMLLRGIVRSRVETAVGYGCAVIISPISSFFVPDGHGYNR